MARDCKVPMCSQACVKKSGRNERESFLKRIICNSRQKKLKKQSVLNMIKRKQDKLYFRKHIPENSKTSIINKIRRMKPCKRSKRERKTKLHKTLSIQSMTASASSAVTVSTSEDNSTEDEEDDSSEVNCCEMHSCDDGASVAHDSDKYDSDGDTCDEDDTEIDESECAGSDKDERCKEYSIDLADMDTADPLQGSLKVAIGRPNEFRKSTHKIKKIKCAKHKCIAKNEKRAKQEKASHINIKQTHKSDKKCKKSVTINSPKFDKSAEINVPNVDQSVNIEVPNCDPPVKINVPNFYNCRNMEQRDEVNFVQGMERARHGIEHPVHLKNLRIMLSENHPEEFKTENVRCNVVSPTSSVPMQYNRNNFDIEKQIILRAISENKDNLDGCQFPFDGILKFVKENYVIIPEETSDSNLSKMSHGHKRKHAKTKHGKSKKKRSADKSSRKKHSGTDQIKSPHNLENKKQSECSASNTSCKSSVVCGDGGNSRKASCTNTCEKIVELSCASPSASATVSRRISEVSCARENETTTKNDHDSDISVKSSKTIPSHATTNVEREKTTLNISNSNSKTDSKGNDVDVKSHVISSGICPSKPANKDYEIEKNVICEYKPIRLDSNANKSSSKTDCKSDTATSETQKEISSCQPVNEDAVSTACAESGNCVKIDDCGHGANNIEISMDTGEEISKKTHGTSDGQMAGGADESNMPGSAVEDTKNGAENAVQPEEIKTGASPHDNAETSEDFEVDIGEDNPTVACHPISPQVTESTITTMTDHSSHNMQPLPVPDARYDGETRARKSKLRCHGRNPYARLSPFSKRRRRVSFLNLKESKTSQMNADTDSSLERNCSTETLASDSQLRFAMVNASRRSAIAKNRTKKRTRFRLFPWLISLIIGLFSSKPPPVSLETEV